MEPTKFEKQIRQQLEDREIQPSSTAWDTLEGMLDNASSKSKPIVWWYAAAAILVGVMLVASFVYTNHNEVEVDIANEEAVEAIKNETPTPFETQLENKTAPFQTKENTNVVIELEEGASRAKHNKKIINATSSKNNIAKVALSATSNKQESKSIEKPVETNKTFVIDQVDKVVAQVQDLQQSNEVTADEVESLLKQAQKEISTQRILSQTKVDPIALLGDAEYELNKSFREKVFLALGDGYDAVKVALQERNN